MTTPYSKFREVRFFGSLDGLRALSIVGVIWFHCWWGTPYFDRFQTWPVLRQGSFGVHIFFVISGFLITTLLLRERDRVGQISSRDFYIRRALRIWPLYYATIAIYLVVVLLFERNFRGQCFFHYLPSFLTYTYTWFISPKWNGGIFNLSWTLATEEQFYAFWPLVLRFFRGIRSTIVIVALIALNLATAKGWTHSFLPPGWLPTRVVLSISSAICFGVLLAQALHSETGFRWLYSILGRKWSAPAALFLLAVSLAPAGDLHFVTAVAATTALVGACVIREDNGFAAILRLRPIAQIGVLSYGMYLLNSLSIHAAGYLLGRVGIGQPVLIFLLALAIVTSAAYVSYRYFESYFLRLKTRFARVHPAPAEIANDGIPEARSGIPVHP